MPLEISLVLSDEQLDQIAEAVVRKIGKTTLKPLTVAEFAKATGKSWSTIKNRVDAGVILKIDRPGITEIPYSELERWNTGAPLRAGEAGRSRPNCARTRARKDAKKGCHGGISGSHDTESPL